jgi:broad specificity phosphatase PhoE
MDKGETSMPQTTLHFVRHGKVENPDHLLYERLPNFHLSALGMRMAQATARYIAANPEMSQTAALYSSPLDRTRETAQVILDALNVTRRAGGEATLTVRTDRRLIEAGNEFRGLRIGYGKAALWRPRSLKLLRNLWRPSWGESYRHIADRVSDFAQETVRNHPGEQVIVVSHESPIWSYRHMLETGHPEHNMLLRHTALASITSITYDSETGKVLHIAYADPAADVQ